MTRIVAVVLGAWSAACGITDTELTGSVADGAADDAAARDAGRVAAEVFNDPPADGAAPRLDATTPPDDAGAGDASGSGSLSPGPLCTARDSEDAPYDPDSGDASYENVATGTVTGSGVSGVICHAEARLYLSTATTPPNLFLLDLYSSSLPNDSAFQSPPGASNAFFTGYFSVGAAPGTYGSATGEPCGGLVFSYDLPVPPSVDCDGGVPGSCPTGCTSACSGFGCSPCVPVAPQVGYETYGSTDCLGNTQTTQGSWTATLTSVVPNGGSAPDAMATDYTIHGTFTANMTQGDSGADTAALTFSF